MLQFKSNIYRSDVINDEGNYLPLFSLFYRSDNQIVDNFINRDNGYFANGDIVTPASRVGDLIAKNINDLSLQSKTSMVTENRFKNRFISDINNFVNDYYTRFPSPVEYGSTSGHHGLNASYITNSCRKYAKIYVNKGCVRILDDKDDLKTVFCVMIKKKYIPLFKMYYLMEIMPFGEMFEVWFDSKSILDHCGRIPFLTSVANWYREGGILLRDIQNIDDRLVAKYKPREVKSADDYQNMIKTILTDLKTLFLYNDSTIKNSREFSSMCNL